MEILSALLKNIALLFNVVFGRLHDVLGGYTLTFLCLILGFIFGAVVMFLISSKWAKRASILANWRDNWKNLVATAFKRRLKVRSVKYLLPFFIFIPIDILICRDVGAIAKFIINFTFFSDQFGQSYLDIFDSVEEATAIQLLVQYERSSLYDLLEKNFWLLRLYPEASTVWELQLYAWVALRNMVYMWPYCSLGQIRSGFSYLLSIFGAYFLCPEVYVERTTFLRNVWKVIKTHILDGEVLLDEAALQKFIELLLHYSSGLDLALSATW